MKSRYEDMIKKKSEGDNWKVDLQEKYTIVCTYFQCLFDHKSVFLMQDCHK